MTHILLPAAARATEGEQAGTPAAGATGSDEAQERTEGGVEGTHSISLRQALERARRDPAAVLAAHAALMRAKARGDLADAGWLPTVSAQASYGYAYDNRLVLPDVPRINSESLEAQGNLSLEWNALDLSRGDRIDEASALTQAAKHRLASTQQATMLAAAELFFQARAAVALVKDAKVSLSRRERQLHAAEALVKSGVRSPADALRARVELTSAHYNLELRRSEQRAVVAALSTALGAGEGERFLPTDSGDTMPVVADPAEALRTARAHSPRIREARASRQAAESAHDAALGLRLPVIGVAGTGTVSYVDVKRGLGLDGHQFGANVGVFVRFQGLDVSTWMQGSVTSAALAEAEQRVSEAAQRVGGEGVAAYYALERARIESERAAAIFGQAEEARVSQNGRYDAGLSSLLELLDAEQLSQDARVRRIEAEREEATARARLLATCGLLGVETGGAGR